MPPGRATTRGRLRRRGGAARHRGGRAPAAHLRVRSRPQPPRTNRLQRRHPAERALSARPTPPAATPRVRELAASAPSYHRGRKPLSPQPSALTNRLRPAHAWINDVRETLQTHPHARGSDPRKRPCEHTRQATASPEHPAHRRRGRPGARRPDDGRTRGGRDVRREGHQRLGRGLPGRRHLRPPLLRRRDRGASARCPRLLEREGRHRAGDAERDARGWRAGATDPDDPTSTEGSDPDDPTDTTGAGASGGDDPRRRPKSRARSTCHRPRTRFRCPCWCSPASRSSCSQRARSATSSGACRPGACRRPRLTSPPRS